MTVQCTLILTLIYILHIFNYGETENINIDSLNKLRNAINQSNNSIIAFYTNANLVSTKSLFKGLNLNYVLTQNESVLVDGVKNGSYLSGCVVGISQKDNAVLNVIKTGIIEGHAIFTLPDVSNEYPHGASTEQSRKEFRNAINVAIMKVQAEGTDFELATKYDENIVDVKTCKIDNIDEYPIPNRGQATGLLRTILDNGTVLVGSFGSYNSTESDEGDEEFPFHSAYLKAIFNQFALLSGSDGIQYGPVNIERIYATSSTPNLLRGRVHISEPYFLIDNVYRGSRERCTKDEDCVKSNTPNGYESCTNNICIAHIRPISEIFKFSCLTYGTESLFIMKKINSTPPANQPNTKLSNGALAAIIILTISLISFISLLIFMVFRERKGNPLFG